MKYADLEEQYARNPEVDRAEVQKIVEWSRVQPHIPDLCEEEVLLFYCACKYSVEITKQVVDNNLTVRTHVGEFFSNMDCELPELQRAMQTVATIPLTQCTPEGYRVNINKLMDTNVANFNFADAIKLSSMVYDMWILQDGVRPGDIIVIDLKGCTLGHVARVGILQIKKYLFYLQEAVPIQLKSIHYINVVPFIDKITGLMNPFVKKELKDVLHFHTDLETFYQFVPKSILPKDYGGPGPTINELKDMVCKNLQENRLTTLKLEKRLRIEESLRPGKPKNASDLFGVEGNFKKLDID